LQVEQMLLCCSVGGGGMPASLLTTVCFSSIRKRIPQQPCSHQKGAAHKPPSTIFSFTPKHVQTTMIYLPENGGKPL
uniref:Uncharacterized protein n=1 Tax=Cyclopterus lumpus TaxID=8103 RepID=A0A8C3A2U9_CYCLU